MNPVRTILAPTDLSPLARHAVVRAALVAAELGARLSVQHVVNVGALDALRHLIDAGAADLQQTLLDEVRGEVTALAAEIEARHAVQPELHLVVGNVLAEIASHADAIDADVLVMGARGAGFVRELLIGSTTERVLRKTRRPVLAVKQRPQGAYRRVLVPVDFSAHAVAATQTAHRWLPDADIVLLHAFEVDIEGTLRFASIAEEQIHQYRVRAREDALDAMAQFVDRLSIPAGQLTRLVVHGAPTLRILEHEQSLDVDLIAMGKHGQSTLEELLLGSVTKHVLAYSSSDVLVAGHPA